MAENEERPRAVRLTISYSGNRLELVSQQSVTMKVPPSAPVENLADQAGFWVDLKDAEDRTLYRQVMHNPIRQDVEVFSPDSGQTVQRSSVDQPRGVFSVVLPELEAARAVSLIASPLWSIERIFAIEQSEKAREIGRFDLRSRR